MGQEKIVICDPNILACLEWKDLLEQLADSGAVVDLNQGIDVRLATPDKIAALNKIRIYTLRRLKFNPFVMVYDREHAAPIYKDLQRWVNNRRIFWTCERFEDYDKIKGRG